jgi:hypothetical protein
MEGVWILAWSFEWTAQEKWPWSVFKVDFEKAYDNIN